MSMTENEAIEKLNMLDEALNFQRHDADECSFALQMAIQALEKQIPKKPSYNGANWYRCPNGCEVHKKQFEKDWYCPKCGQRLDWQ